MKKSKKKTISAKEALETKLISTSAEMSLSSIQKVDTESTDKIDDLRDKANDWFTYFNEHITRARNYLTFLYVDQWEQQIRQNRESQSKPTLTADKLVPIINGILGEYRSNTPALSVRALDNDTQQDQIEWRTNLLRQIHYASDGDTQYQTVLKNCLETGWGGFRISIEFENADTFDQCIKMKAIPDYQSAFWDPSAQELDKSDGDYCGWYDVVSKDDFELAYPGVNPPESIGNNYYYRWDVRDVVLVANIYVKEYFKKTLAKLSDGREMALDEANDAIEKNKKLLDEIAASPFADILAPSVAPLEIIQTRKVLDYKLKFYRFIDNAILEKGDWPGKILPIIYVDGNSTVIDGERIPISYIQGAIDSQKFFNYIFSQTAYSVLRARQEQWMGTETNFRGREQIWRQPQNVQGALTYLPDPVTGKPERIDPSSFDHTLLDALSFADNQIAMNLGRYDESRGNESNAISGAAISKRQRVGNYPVNVPVDNVNRGAESIGKIIMELIPFVYSNQRQVATRDAKGNTQTIDLNKPTGVFQYNEQGDIEEQLQNDVSKGKYDIEVRIDGSYDEQRLEALDTLIKFSQVYPPFAQIIPDLLAEESGLENTQVLIERAKTLLPPNIVALEKGQPPPPPQPPPPDPKVMLEQQKLALEKEKLAMQKQIADQDNRVKQLEMMLKTQREQDQAQMEKYRTDIELLKAGISSRTALAQEHIRQVGKIHSNNHKKEVSHE